MKRNFENSKCYKFFTRDVSEFSKFKLFVLAIVMIGTGALLSSLFTFSYALFGDEISGSNTIEVSVSNK